MSVNYLEQFTITRKRTEEICAPLEIEDYVVQPISDVSPPKWHLAHSTWFFEQFILVNHAKSYDVFHEDFAFLFNSYYNNMGKRSQRHHRGFMTRPTVSKVLAYRKYVTQKMQELIQENPSKEVLDLVEIGIRHEQQHQELLAYDIKYILGSQPTFPSLGRYFDLQVETHDQDWINVTAGLYDIGFQGDGFCFDNELPVHKQYVQDYQISNKLITNGEYLEFMNDGGYQNFDLWHEEGWHFINNNNLASPLYWHRQDKDWSYYTYNGLEKINKDLPVMHISLFEAYAFAEWKGMRLPTEFEWEIASDKFKWGQVWEWTNSAYLPYPGFTKVEGALGEYNGKFMVNQKVLRGSSVATPAGHGRSTYRNFFGAGSRWVYAGFSLVKK